MIPNSGDFRQVDFTQSMTLEELRLGNSTAAGFISYLLANHLPLPELFCRPSAAAPASDPDARLWPLNALIKRWPGSGEPQAEDCTAEELATYSQTAATQFPVGWHHATTITITPIPEAAPQTACAAETVLINQEWQTPVIADDAPPVKQEWQPFPTELVFPKAIADFVVAGASALGVDESMLALPVLAACAGVIGNARVLRLNATWAERAAFWCVVIGESGSRKTPPFKLAMQPVWRINSRLMNENATQLLLWKNACSQVKAGDLIPPKPKETRLIAQDVTIEKLGLLLSENPKGLLLAENELAGWFNSFTRYQGGSSVSAWLNFYDGAPTIVDRISRPSINLECPLISVCGTTQPAVLDKLLDSESWASGLAPRMILCYPPSEFRLYREPPEVIPEMAGYEKILQFCAELAGTGLELKFDDQAKKVWMDDLNFRNKFAHYHASGSRKAQLAKISSIPARWGLVHHVLQEAANGSQAWESQIGVPSIAAGCFLAQWCEDESARVSGLLATASQDATDDVWLRCLQGKPDGLTAAQLSRNHATKLPHAVQAEALLERLAAQHKVVKRITKNPKNGKTTTTYSLS